MAMQPASTPVLPALHRRQAAAWLAAALLTPSLSGWAQVPAPAPTPPLVEGPTRDGKTFRLSALKGKVVLLMAWSTGCAVCRDKMPELRQNVSGWSGQPFEMVLVSVDRRQQDLADYEQILARTVPPSQRFVQLWSGDAAYRDNLGLAATAASALPLALLIDKTGRVVERYNGRIPAEAWDRIADLL
jgi:thiol-disulfide isomerase/thioredoxin